MNDSILDASALPSIHQAVVKHPAFDPKSMTLELEGARLGVSPHYAGVTLIPFEVSDADAVTRRLKEMFDTPVGVTLDGALFVPERS